MPRHLLLPILAFLILACNNPRKSAPVATVIADTAAITTTQPVLDTVWVPSVSYGRTFDNNILRPGQFHSEEVDTLNAYNNWLGLFYKDGAFYLAKTEIVLSRVHDEIADDEDSTVKTGIMVGCSNKDSAILFINTSTIPLKEGVVTAVNLNKNEFDPGFEASFTMGGIGQYSIKATADNWKKDDQGRAVNYKLIFDLASRKLQQQVLAANPEYSGPDYILFCGDLDRDGRPDFVILTGAENLSETVLYLSSKAGAGEMVKMVGQHVATGC